MLDKLKRLFIITDENEDENSNYDSINFTEEAVLKSTDYSNIKGKFSMSIMTDLLTALENNNQEEFDYLEYKGVIKAMESLKVEEVKKYRSAYTTAETFGITSQEILNSITFYIDVLNKENDSFKKSLQENNNRITTSKKEAYAKLLKTKQAQLKELNKEIIDLKDILSGNNVVRYSKGDFDATFYTLIQELNSDTAKIHKYLM